MRDLPPMLPKLKIAVLTPNDEVIDRVREAAEWSEKAAKNLPVAANITGIKLAYAGAGRARPLRRLRSAHRAREHHAAAEDHQ